jgi:hypothetical protein
MLNNLSGTQSNLTAIDELRRRADGPPRQDTFFDSDDGKRNRVYRIQQAVMETFLPNISRDGATICARCSTEFTDEVTCCPDCGGILILLAPARPQQETLFPIPLPSWRVEWRWTPRALEFADPPDPIVNDWKTVVYTSVATSKTVIEASASRLRDKFPEKEFRVVEDWS